MTARLRRSVLYIPGSNRRALDKALALPCDAVILDLEDAVAPGAKSSARTAAVEAIRARRFGDREVVVRINGLGSAWGADDLAAMCAARPDAILAPKISAPDDIDGYLAADLPLWAMVETCRAVLSVGRIAECKGLSALVFGGNDLAAEMGASITAGRQPLHATLGLTVMAARAQGLAVIDGVFNDLGDPAGFKAECAEGAAFGFDGKTLIHPSQIDVCNAAFAPDAAAVAKAQAIVAAFGSPESADLGVVLVDGRMTERLHLAQARRLLAIHEAASRADLS